MRALVVDDVATLRRLLAAALEGRGHDVVCAADAEAALRIHRERPFDLVLTDWALPGASGLELCRAIRSMDGGSDPVILIVTSRSDTQDVREALTSGASDYLTKPIDREQLRLRIQVAEQLVARVARERERASRAPGEPPGTTELQPLEVQSRLMQADQLASVGTLAAGVAHELNNPLAYVVSNLELVREELRAHDAGWTQEHRTHLLGLVEESIHGASRMGRIVRDLKTFSRVDDEPHEAVDVLQVLQASVHLCWNELRHRAQLELRLEQVPPVRINESRLGQVCLNLLINAAQAMPERQSEENRIIVSARTTDAGWAEICVEDTGRGIDPKHLARIFDPFFTTKSPGEGTGLGLSICRNIVEGAGGTLGVESRRGTGTTALVRLPPTTPAPQPPTRDENAPQVRGSVARVLVVDDEPLVGRSVKRALRGHDVRVVSSGREALHILAADPGFDLVLCDLMMPDVSGMDVYERIQEQQPELAQTFVFMTGGAFTPRAREFLRTITVQSLDKPFDPSQLRTLASDRATRTSDDDGS